MDEQKIHQVNFVLTFYCVYNDSTFFDWHISKTKNDYTSRYLLFVFLSVKTKIVVKK